MMLEDDHDARGVSPHHHPVLLLCSSIDSHLSLSLVLPRNGLTATGARRLFGELPQIREVNHDPGAVLLTSAGSAHDLTFIELSMNNIIQWM